MKAARDLIEGYAVEIAAADARINVALQQIDSLRKLQMLSEARAQELETVIKAEREAKVALVKLKTEQEKKIKSLEKSLSRTRKFALIAGVAAGVAILIGARK